MTMAAFDKGGPQTRQLNVVGDEGILIDDDGPQPRQQLPDVPAQKPSRSGGVKQQYSVESFCIVSSPPQGTAHAGLQNAHMFGLE